MSRKVFFRFCTSTRTRRSQSRPHRLALEQYENRLLLSNMVADIRSTRPMSDEGLLTYLSSGHERAGAILSAHPSQVGIDNVKLGFDVGTIKLLVHPTNVVDNFGASGHAGNQFRPDIDFANQIFSQLGISVIATSAPTDVRNRAVSAQVTTTRPFLLTPETEVFKVLGGGRDADNTTVEVFYVDQFLWNDFEQKYQEGEAFPPNSDAVVRVLLESEPGRTGAGIILGSTASTPLSADTFAHELGHWLLDSSDSGELPRFLNTENVHSPRPTDLMFRGPGREKPSGFPYTTKDGFGDLNTSAPAESGRPNGNLGGIDLFLEPVFIGGEGGLQVDQAEQMLKSASIVRSGENHGGGYGNRADFLWLENNHHIEDIPGAIDRKETLNPPTRDDLIWGIDPLSHVNPDPPNAPEGKWFGDKSRLTLNAYSQEYFTHIDVLSVVARYADNDVDEYIGEWSAEASALDYVVEFCDAEGTGDECATGWEEGTPELTFTKGWDANATADDHVTRWAAPERENSEGDREIIHAKRIKISPRIENGGDGNTQIDAIIAGKATANMKTMSFEYERGFGSGGVDEYRVELDIVDPDEVVGTFSVTLYGSIDGVTPSELIRTQPVNWAGGDSQQPVEVIFDDIDLSELGEFSSIIVVVNSENDVAEISKSDNSITLDIVNTGYGVEIGAVDGVLTDPAGFEFEILPQTQLKVD
jgi:hypothetical protein